MDYRGTHIVVAGGGSVRVLVFFENDRIILLANPHRRGEGMRFRNLVDRFQISGFILQGKNLPGAVRPDGFNRRRLHSQSQARFGPKPEARRYPVLEDFEHHTPAGGRDLMGFVVVMAFMRVSMTMAMTVTMMLAAAQEPSARDVHRETKTGDRDRLGEMDRHGIEDTADGFIADQERDH